MNATMVASGTKAVPPVVSSIQDIPPAKIRESKTNPRRVFDETKLAELADSVPRNKIRVCVIDRFVTEAAKRRMPAGSPRSEGHITDGRDINLYGGGQAAAA